MSDGTRPDRFYPYERKVRRCRLRRLISQDWTDKADLLASWLDLPLESRPSFIAAYLPDVDQGGHRSGPTSEALNAELSRLDDFAAAVHRMIDERNLGQIVDLIFTSDHGMSSTADERVLYLDDMLGSDGFAGIETKEGWPSCGLRFKAGVDEQEMLRRLRKAASAPQSGFNVYTAADMPPQWHFSSEVNSRIAPIYAVPQVGCVVTLFTRKLILQLRAVGSQRALPRHERQRAYRKSDSVLSRQYVPKGIHGYDPAHPDMHAVFVAHGPFADRLKRRRKFRRRGANGQLTIIPPDRNLEVRGVPCDSR